MKMNKRIRFVFWVIFALFTALIIYIGYFTLFRSADVINNPYNLRLAASEASVKRGNIEDRNGVVLAESIRGEDGFVRQYNYPREYCHVIGYTGVGKTGAEAAYNSTLLTLHNETLQKFLYIVTNKVFKDGKFSLTGLGDTAREVFAADIEDQTVQDNGDLGVLWNEEDYLPKDTATTEKSLEIYENSDLDNEIKDIYNDIDKAEDVNLDEMVSDGYESENNFFAPTEEGYVLTGNTLMLSIDHRLQEKAYELLGQRRGSIVLSDVNTGKILAMVSYPDYNPQTVAENWDDLTTDEENTPLLNRASQGLYPPGSVFKIGMAQLLIDSGNEAMTYDCNGEGTFGGKTLGCYNKTAHGHEGLEEAFKDSCNGFFAQAGLLLTKDRLITEALNLGYNKDFDFPLEHSVSVFMLDENSDDAEVADTSIGQGKTMVSPLHINMITQAVANGGIMYAPQIALGLKSSSGRVIKTFKPKEMGVVMPEETAARLNKLMRQVVTDGTARDAADSFAEIAGKTGTAENGTEKDHIWFTGFAPYENPQYAVTVMFEYGGREVSAVETAKDLLEFAEELEDTSDESK